VDFQIFLLMPFVAALAAYKHNFTLALLGVCTCVSVGYAWIAGYQNDWSIDILDQGAYFQDYYIKPW
jgi:hypothetical protein